MSPVGWRGGHLSSGHRCLAGGRSAGHRLPSAGGGEAGRRAPCCSPATLPACLARRLSGAGSAYAFTFLPLPGEPGRRREAESAFPCSSQRGWLQGGRSKNNIRVISH